MIRELEIEDASDEDHNESLHSLDTPLWRARIRPMS